MRSTLDPDRFSFSASKSLHHINLLRMGIIKSNGLRVNASPRYDEGYLGLDDKDLKKWYNEIVSSLKDLPHGPTRLAVKIFQVDGARILQKRGHLHPDSRLPVSRPMPGLSSAAHRRRPREDDDDLDLSSDTPIPPSRRRRVQ